MSEADQQGRRAAGRRCPRSMAGLGPEDAGGCSPSRTTVKIAMRPRSGGSMPPWGHSASWPGRRSRPTAGPTKIIASVAISTTMPHHPMRVAPLRRSASAGHAGMLRRHRHRRSALRAPGPRAERREADERCPATSTTAAEMSRPSEEHGDAGRDDERQRGRLRDAVRAFTLGVEAGRDDRRRADGHPRRCGRAPLDLRIRLTDGERMLIPQRVAAAPRRGWRRSCTPAAGKSSPTRASRRATGSVRSAAP